MQNCFSLRDATGHSETLLCVAFRQAEPEFSGTGAFWAPLCQQSSGLCCPWKSKALPQLDLLQCGKCLPRLSSQSEPGTFLSAFPAQG